MNHGGQFLYICIKQMGVVPVSNKSIKQVHQEIENAKKDALTSKYITKNERSDVERGGQDYGDMYESGNSLSDIVVAKRNAQQSGHQIVPFLVKLKIEHLFEKQPIQYKILGLYFAGGFTFDEIAFMEDMKRPNVIASLKRGVKRLKDKLTEQEYDSIRWLVRDLKTIPATPKQNYEGYRSTYTAQVGEIIRPQRRTI